MSDATTNNGPQRRWRDLLVNPWALVALLLVSFGLTSLLQRETGDGDEQGSSKIYPQTFMTQVETRSYNAQGQLQHQLNTPLITSFQVNPDQASPKDYTLFANPRISFQDQPGQSPWQLQAQLGRSSGDGKQLLLSEGVLIEQQSPEQGLIQITTSELLVRPADQYAETDKAVKMRSAKGQMDAIGMAAELRTNRIELQSQVRAVYESR